jgi:dolichyl-phosphate-mannose--protein O-mannosyl transferase
MKLTLLDNALVTQSRLILLDSPLVIFTAITALAFTSFTNQHEQGPSKAFQPAWWFWLAATGLGLGATVSVKWVGLFTIAWVGSLTLLQLWVLLGDTKNVTPVSKWLFSLGSQLTSVATLVQALLCSPFLPGRDSGVLLHGHVRYPFPVPR